MTQEISNTPVDIVVENPVEADAKPVVEIDPVLAARMSRIKSASNRTERERRRAALR